MKMESRNYFLATVCQVCKTKECDYPCEVCRMIFYCSPEHRRQNWINHSELCWAVNKICDSGNSEILWDLYDGRDFTKFRHDIANRCTALLNRCLKSWELEMIYYPRVCSVCRNWKDLRLCQNCEYVFTCSKGHFPSNHKKWCKTLKLYSDLILFQSLKPNVDVKLQKLEINAQACKSMADVFIADQNKNKFEHFEVQKALMSEILTYPLTVCESLKFLDLNQKKELKILFIGAEVQAEVQPLEKWENYLLHILDNIHSLFLIFLGPELEENDTAFSANLCEKCRKQQKQLRIQFISRKFFHEYNNNETPDLICAFNSGMYRDYGFRNKNSWKETIEKIFQPGNPPILITEYTSRELKMVLEKIKLLCGKVEIKVQPVVNPFASLKPGLNIISEDEIPVIFKNYFCTIVFKK